MAEAMNGLVDGMDDVERAAVTRRLTGTVEILRRSTAEPIRALPRSWPPSRLPRRGPGGGSVRLVGRRRYRKEASMSLMGLLAGCVNPGGTT